MLINLDHPMLSDFFAKNTYKSMFIDVSVGFRKAASSLNRKLHYYSCHGDGIKLESMIKALEEAEGRVILSNDILGSNLNFVRFSNSTVILSDKFCCIWSLRDDEYENLLKIADSEGYINSIK